MTDPDSLLHDLQQAAQLPSTNPAAAVVDADVARGRRALHHRRARRIGTRSALAGVLALGTFALVHPQGSGSGTTTAQTPTPTPPALTTSAIPPAVTTTTPPKSHDDLAVRLVAYTGKQPAGYTVSSVPAGWEIQGVDNFTLVIAPVGFKDRSLNDFEGKLVVMLGSVDQTEPTDGVPVVVGSGKGLVSHFDPGLPILYFTDTAGRLVVVQQPGTLHWSDAQLAAFGGGVHVNASAEQGHG